MDKALQAHIEEMNRLADAIYRTDSPYLKKDYAKALNRMEKELREYQIHMSKYNERKRLEVNHG